MVNAWPKKIIGAGKRGTCLCEELEKIQVMSLLISFAAQSAGLLLQLPCLVTHLLGPAHLRSPGIPAACPGEPLSPLGALAEASEVPGIAAPGGAGYPVLQHVTTVAEPTHAALSTAPGPCCARCCTHCFICALGCRDSLYLGLSLVGARQKERSTLPDQDSAGNKAQSTF